MDIQLEDGAGFDTLKAFSEIDFKLIFTTAFNQFAVNAFKFSAVDYLLKPIDPIELKAPASVQQAPLHCIMNTKQCSKLLKII